MDLRQLRYFLTIVEEGSLSRAAARLHVAQPALSIHIRNMEADLGSQLLFRSPRGVIATEAGQILVRHARMILAQIALAEEEIRGQREEPEGEVRLGLPATLGQLLAVPLLTAAHQHYPKVRLKISEAMSGFVLEWLTEARVDLAMLYVEFPSGAITTQAVLEEELRFIGPVRDPAVPLPAAGTPIALAQALELPLILPSLGHGLRAQIEAAAKAADLSVAPVIDIDSYGNIKNLVAEGLGYSILPESAVALDAFTGRLRLWPLGTPPLRRRVHLAHASDRPLSTAATAIHGLIRRVLEELVAEQRWSGARLLLDEADPAPQP